MHSLKNEQKIYPQVTLLLVTLPHPLKSVAVLYQGAPGQMTWLEDPPPCLAPQGLALRIALLR